MKKIINTLIITGLFFLGLNGVSAFGYGTYDLGDGIILNFNQQYISLTSEGKTTSSDNIIINGAQNIQSLHYSKSDISNSIGIISMVIDNNFYSLYRNDATIITGYESLEYSISDNQDQLKIPWNSGRKKLYTSKSNYTYVTSPHFTNVKNPLNEDFLTYVNLDENGITTFSFKSISSVPDDAICSTEQIETKDVNKYSFSDGIIEIESEDSLIIQEGQNSIGLKTYKNGSGSLVGLFNGNNDYQLTKPFWTTGEPEFQMNMSEGIDYFNIDFEGSANITPKITNKNQYRVKLCEGNYLKNPSSEIEYPTLDEQTIFFGGKKYVLPQKYSCLKYIFPTSTLGVLKINKFEIGKQIPGEIKETEVCYYVNEDNIQEVYVDGESFSGSINDIGKNGEEIQEIIKTTTWSDEISAGIDNGMDKDGDGIVTAEESRSGLISFFYSIVKSISDTAQNISDFISSFFDYGNVEKKDLFGWLIPSANAQYDGNRLAHIFGESTENFKQGDTPFIKILRFLYWSLLAVGFLGLLYFLGKNKND